MIAYKTNYLVSPHKVAAVSTSYGSISAFCKRFHMSEREFGLRATHNPHLVRRLKHGLEIKPETAAKVKQFMRTYAS